MSMSDWVVGLCVCLCVAATPACEADLTIDADVADAADVADVSGTEDGGSGDSDAGSDSGADIAEVVVEGEFVIGFNLTGTNTPADYTALATGESLNIEYGPQGLWMVVLAFKTRNIFDPKAKLTMTASCITEDGNLRGELALAKQTPLAGGDGWYYYYNLFLVVDEVGAAGKTAAVNWTVQDPESGASSNETVEVVLTGGP